ncbi:hypothetical protein NE236_30215 [Actinoallomurus purpureus]|uniref:hypothetical protein n=1 Tax=Actinoallomurus purpureus TaxID=478114 RepID=UPI002093497A|nr:hypothetical protein [Actinoallomurus purpureus]MCO6009254.1 hypothetical protein [Actinoallomurus purpureus]
MAIDRVSTGSDAGAEKIEENPPTARRLPPPDRPGQEPEGVPSRLESRRAVAALNEQAAERPSETTDADVPEATSEQGSAVADRNPESPVTPQSAETSETKDKSPSASGPYDADRDQPRVADPSSAADTSVDQHTPDGAVPTREVDDGSASQATDKFVSPPEEAPGERRGGVHDDPIGASAEDETEEDDRRTASTPDAAAEQQPLERTDKPHEVKPPEIVGDYYTNIPPTAQDRYLVRDQANPVPVFDGSPTRDQAAQGTVGDCGIVATLGAVAEHRPDAIKDAIKQVGDGEYEIALHDITEATPAAPVARPTGDITTYRLNDELPVRTDTPTQPPAGIQAESCGWPALIEKAIAAEDQTWDAATKAGWEQAWTTWHKPAVDQDRANAGLGASPDDPPMGYNRLDLGSTAYQRADLLAKLTGEEAEVRRIPGERQGEQALLDGFRDQLSAGKPVLVGTRGLRVTNERLPDGIYAGHAYEVTKVENDKIHIRNPWGYDHPDPMDAKTFWEYYRRYNQDGTRGGYYTTLK